METHSDSVNTPHTRLNVRRRPRSKGEFVRLLWHSHAADFVDTVPDNAVYLVIERDKTHFLLIPWDVALDDAIIPDWVWWPCYFRDQEEVVCMTQDAVVQVLDAKELAAISTRYLQHLEDDPTSTPFV